MNFLEKFSAHYAAKMAALLSQRYLLAVSGGVDSVVLTHLFYKLGFTFTIAHCNFQLRDAESERDEQFTRTLAEEYNKEIQVKRFDTLKYAADKKISIQVAARDLRYDWFRSITNGEQPTHLLVTAHHADDDLETVFMHFLRGTGLSGLTGMNTESTSIFRPLLPFRKYEILAYAQENNLSYVEDSSNAESKYTRNYFRNELLPAVRKVYPEAEENILKNIERLKLVEQVYSHAIILHKKNVIEIKGEEEHIPILKLTKLPFYPIVLWEIIKEKSFTSGQLNEVIKLANADTGSYIDSESHRIIKNRKWLIITRNLITETTPIIVIDASAKKVDFGNKRLTIENFPHINFNIPALSTVACLDAKHVTFPLLLRKAKQGDYFYPLGMKKKKKLSRFLIDQKLSKTEKESVWILESNKRIVWVIAHRIDERYKIDENTQDIIKISVTT